MTMPEGPHGPLMSLKNDITDCMRYQALIQEQHEAITALGLEEYQHQLAANKHEREIDGYCRCGVYGRAAVWSELMKIPDDKIEMRIVRRSVVEQRAFLVEYDREVTAHLDFMRNNGQPRIDI